MKEEYDFSNAVKNPFAGKFKDGYTFIIRHNDTGGGWEEVKNVKPTDMDAEIAETMRKYAAKI